MPRAPGRAKEAKPAACKNGHSHSHSSHNLMLAAGPFSGEPFNGTRATDCVSHRKMLLSLRSRSIVSTSTQRQMEKSASWYCSTPADVGNHNTPTENLCRSAQNVVCNVHVTHASTCAERVSQIHHSPLRGAAQATFLVRLEEEKGTGMFLLQCILSVGRSVLGSPSITRRAKPCMMIQSSPLVPLISAPDTRSLLLRITQRYNCR